MRSMRIEIMKIKVTLDDREALSIINALQTGLKDHEFIDKKPEEEAAIDFLSLLRNNFQNSQSGIHWPERKEKVDDF